jgi:carboxypeptidase Q
MRRNLISFIVCVALARAQAPDLGMLAKIRAEAMDHAQVAPVFDMFTVTIGPRLTASPAQKHASEYARDRLAG